MKVGFDCDGVLCDIEHVDLFLMHTLSPEMEEKAEYYYYRLRTPILNPEDFLHDGDKFYIITGRHSKLYNITKAWCDKYVPNYSGLYVVGGKPWYMYTEQDFKSSDYSRKADEKKAEKINELGIELFIDDNPRTVGYLRENCPNTKIIRFGGRL